MARGARYIPLCPTPSLTCQQLVEERGGWADWLGPAHGWSPSGLGEAHPSGVCICVLACMHHDCSSLLVLIRSIRCNQLGMPSSQAPLMGV